MNRRNQGCRDDLFKKYRIRNTSHNFCYLCHAICLRLVNCLFSSLVWKNKRAIFSNFNKFFQLNTVLCISVIQRVSKYSLTSFYMVLYCSNIQNIRKTSIGSILLWEGFYIHNFKYYENKDLDENPVNNLSMILFQMIDFVLRNFFLKRDLKPNLLRYSMLRMILLLFGNTVRCIYSHVVK